MKRGKQLGQSHADTVVRVLGRFVEEAFEVTDVFP